MSLKPVSDRLGVTHTSGCYFPGEGSFLLTGAREILDFGSTTIKVWFSRHPDQHYPHGDKWPEKIESFLDLATAPLFEQLFQMPFTTYVLEAFSPEAADDSSWRSGMSDQEYAAEVAAFRELTVHLRTRYDGTGKTFVTQNWEGDWAARGHFKRDVDPTPADFENFRRWLTARQEGVEAGRAATPFSDVSVWNAAEANLIEQNMAGRPGLVTEVFPKLRCDLYSYSVWDPPAPENLKERLEFIRDHCEPSEAFGRDNVMVGEFGAFEMRIGEKEAAAASKRTAEVALDFGCPYVLFWELYDNECNRTADKTCPGLWLIKPDGSQSESYKALQELIRT